MNKFLLCNKGVENWKKPTLPPLSFIYHIGQTDLLKKPSKVVGSSTIKSPVFQKKLKYLKRCLLKYRKLTGLGKGIAAVQVGIPEKFAVIHTPKRLIAIINPKITKISKNKNKYTEGCMSATPIIVPLIRPEWIEFEYLDEEGNIQTWTGRSLKLNRIFQHEIDHMEGIVNIDIGSSKDFILCTDSSYYKKAKFEKVK